MKHLMLLVGLTLSLSASPLLCQPAAVPIRPVGLDSVIKKLAQWTPPPKGDFETTQQWKARWPAFDTIQVYSAEVPTTTSYDADNGILTIRAEGFLQTDNDHRYVTERFALIVSRTDEKSKQQVYKDKKGKKHAYSVRTYNEFLLGGLQLPTYTVRGEGEYRFNCFSLKEGGYWSRHYRVSETLFDFETDTKPIVVKFEIPMTVDEARTNHGKVVAVFGVSCGGYGTGLMETPESMIENKDASSLVFLEPTRFIAQGVIQYVDFVNRETGESICKLEQFIKK